MKLFLVLASGLLIVWGAISYFISLRFGWHRLQRAMPASNEEAPTTSLRFRPVTVGALTYKNSVIVDIGSSVVTIRQFWPMSKLYPPIQVSTALFDANLQSDYAGMVTVLDNPTKLMVSVSVLKAALEAQHSSP